MDFIQILNSIFLFIIGLSIGSFLNVLIDRLPNGKSIMGRSHCDHCKRTLNWYELIPVMSFLIQNGKSRCCHKKLSIQYPLVEMITGLSFIGIMIYDSRFMNILFINHKSLIINQILLTSIISCFIVIFFTDLKFQIIPDSIQLVLSVFVILFNLVKVFPNYQLLTTNYLLSGFIVMSPILFLWLVTRGRGMGFGDVKLAFTVGVLLGIKGGLIAFYLAFIIGAIFGLFLIIFKLKGLKSKIAFGPFIIIGTIIVMFFQTPIFILIKRFYGL